MLILKWHLDCSRKCMRYGKAMTPLAYAIYYIVLFRSEGAGLIYYSLCNLIGLNGKWKCNGTWCGGGFLANYITTLESSQVTLGCGT